jgi:hypothetical protein
MRKVAQMLKWQTAFGQRVKTGIAGAEESGTGGLDLNSLTLALRLHNLALKHEGAPDVRVLLHRVKALDPFVHDNLQASEAGAVTQLHKRKLASALRSGVSSVRNNSAEDGNVGFRWQRPARARCATTRTR